MILSTLLAIDSAAHTERDRIVVISDTHLLSPDLITPGSAIDRADALESKMMAMSDDIMGAITDSIIGIKPALVLIAGDLTNNGERASHERMAWYLERLAQQGIRSLVIPGNHDCNNPNAVRYDGDKTVNTATVSREEFAQIYRDYGYGKDSKRDTASLSYCCEPLKDVVIIGIDSNMDELNQLTSRGDSTDTYHNAGRIKAETLQWVIDQANDAHRQGKRVIAMMHHHLVPHFDKQERLLANYIVKDYDYVAQQLMQAGIHTIFTGHLHVTDAATYYNNDKSDSIVEVATGSAICYPFAIRTATFDKKHHTLDIDTRWLNATHSCPTLRELGRQRIIDAMPGVAAMIAGKAWNKLGGQMGQLKAMIEMGGGKANLPETPQQATQLTLRHLSEVLSRSMLAVVEGNEQEKDTDSIIMQGKQGIRDMIGEVAPDQAESLWEFFESEVYPKLEPLVRSILEDKNAVGTPAESHTDDLRLSITL
ncbi:MAG: metallophosphoesterase [Muribaculaceae bacterium]|nr:metallophosphoesterase [Muribaculaceae bacterium]